MRKDESEFYSIVEGLESDFPEELIIRPDGKTRLSLGGRNVALGLVGASFGLLIIILGLLFTSSVVSAIIGTLGFLLMVFSGAKLTAPKNPDSTPQTVKQKNKADRRSSKMKRLEEEWDQKYNIHTKRKDEK